MFTLNTLVVLLSASLITAIQVTNPTQQTVWNAAGGAQTLSWKAVSTDATSFVVQLVNQVSHFPPS